MGKLKGKCMNDKEFKWIEKAIWETSKRILNSLEARITNLDLKFFYTPLKTPPQPISMELESHMNEDCGRRPLNILLDIHETIVTQVVTVGCAYKYPLKITRKSLEKTICTQMPFTNVGGYEGLKVSIKIDLFHLLI